MWTGLYRQSKGNMSCEYCFSKAYTSVEKAVMHKAKISTYISNHMRKTKIVLESSGMRGSDASCDGMRFKVKLIID